MINTPFQIKNYLLRWFPVATPLLCLALFVGTPAGAQSVSVQDNKPLQDNDTTRRELAQFDQFMDSHPEIAEQLRKDPSLVNNRDFVANHPALQTFLQEQQGVREEMRENPNAFMRKENRFDRSEDARDRDTSGRERAQFNQFLDSHREIAEQLRKDPSLVNNREFVATHPALQAFLQEQPGVREQIRQNPNAFMQQESRFDRSDRDTTGSEMEHFDQFMDNLREIAEQLRKDPSLVNNREFVANHPALQTFLQEQPEVREQIRQNPNAFMEHENRNGRSEGGGYGDDNDRHVASFRKFLGEHSTIAQQMSKDPSLAKNQEYVNNHPELQAYLNANPGVRGQLMQNPESFVKAA